MSNKVTLITGASRGIGRAIAVRLGAKNDVALFARDKKKLDETASLVKGKALAIPGDIKNEADIKAAVEKTLKEFGRIDVLVNNAGIGTFKRSDQFTLAEFEEIWRVNVAGSFLFTKYVLPGMIDRKSGQVINISSVAGLNGFKSGAAYASSKFALNGFTECLREDVKQYGIAVTAVCPGGVHTDFGGQDAAAHRPSDFSLDADDVARTVEYLVDESETANTKLVELKPRRRVEFRG